MHCNLKLFKSNYKTYYFLGRGDFGMEGVPGLIGQLGEKV